MPTDERAVFDPAVFDDLPGWSEDRHAEVLPALARSCRVLFARGAKASAGGAAEDWRGPCRALDGVAADDHRAARRYFERWFRPWRVITPSGGSEGLFTGYFEPELRGARHKGPGFGVPLYRRPPELVTVDLGDFGEEFAGRSIAGRVEAGRLRPFAARAQIDSGALAGRGLELVWVDDPVDAFFLHVQGSGRVRLRDGSVMRVGFAGRNGHPYTSVGKVLIERGAIAPEAASMQTIGSWLRSNPGKAPAVMAANASYIFFRELDAEGPVGAAGVVLTPGRSLAVDRRHIPLGAPLWLDTDDPLQPTRPLRRLMVAQDTGSAITGAVRGDVFWGHGPAAAARAGRMKQRGRYYLLLPRTMLPADHTARR